MIWVSIKKRKPLKAGNYYWRGKHGYGGYTYYEIESGEFDFDGVPVNKVDEDCVYWLDETDALFDE